MPRVRDPRAGWLPLPLLLLPLLLLAALLSRRRSCLNFHPRRQQNQARCSEYATERNQAEQEMSRRNTSEQGDRHSYGRSEARTSCTPECWTRSYMYKHTCGPWRDSTDHPLAAALVLPAAARILPCFSATLCIVSKDTSRPRGGAETSGRLWAHAKPFFGLRYEVGS